MSADQACEHVSIAVLGAFRVVVGGRVIAEDAWPSRRSAELVQLLALTHRRLLLRDQVMEALWLDLSPAAAGANLRKAAHHARQALGRQDAVVLSEGRVALFPTTPVETDVARFERSAEAALAGADGSACAAAASTYTGDLLPARSTRSGRRSAGRSTRAVRGAPAGERAVGPPRPDRAAGRAGASGVDAHGVG